MAPLIAAQISYENRLTPDRIKIITFGQPRTGTTQFMNSLEKMVTIWHSFDHSLSKSDQRSHSSFLNSFQVPDAVRVVNQQDPIAQVPKRLMFSTQSMQHMFQEARVLARSI